MKEGFGWMSCKDYEMKSWIMVQVARLTTSRKNVWFQDPAFICYFIFLPTTFTISQNSALVNILPSTRSQMRASRWTTWDMRSSSRETICLGSSGVVIETSSCCLILEDNKPINSYYQIHLLFPFVYWQAYAIFFPSIL